MMLEILLKMEESLTFFFEGSEGDLLSSANDWSANFTAEQVIYNSSSGEIMVHRGVYSYFDSIKDEMSEKIINLNSELVTVNLVGYSQGGAISTLLHHYLKSSSSKNGNPEIKLNTALFGAPGAVSVFSNADKTSTLNYLNLTSDIIQFRYGNDAIPYAFDFQYGYNYPFEGRYFHFITDEISDNAHKLGPEDKESISSTWVRGRGPYQGDDKRNPPQAWTDWSYYFLGNLAKMADQDYSEMDHTAYCRLFNLGKHKYKDNASVKIIYYWSASDKDNNFDISDMTLVDGTSIDTLGNIIDNSGITLRYRAQNNIVH